MDANWTRFDETVQPIDDKPLPDGNPNPVKRYFDGWYFYDESWAYCYGPFKTQRECQETSDMYDVLLNMSKDRTEDV